MNNNNKNNLQDNPENENDSKIIQKIINLKLKSFFKYLIMLYKKRMNIYKVQFFLYLKSSKNNTQKILSQQEINKILLSNIILQKLNNCTKNVYYIYKNSIFRKKMIYFEYWRRYMNICSNIEKEVNNKNSYDKKISELNNKIKNANKVKDNLKNEEKKINQSVKLKEEQKNNFLKSIKNLSNKYKQIQTNPNNIINVKNTNNNRNNINITTNSTKNKETEEKKMELESNLRLIKEEDLINDNNFKNFMNNLEINLNKYEEKAQEIIRQKKQKSLEISKTDFDMEKDK